MVRYLFIAAALSLLAGGIVWLDVQSRPAVRPPERSTTQPARRVYASGRVEGATPDVELRFELPGRIVEIGAREGTFVASGALLLRQDDAAFAQRVALRQAEHDLVQAQLLRLKNGAHEQERREAQALWEARQAEFKSARQTWERSVQLRDQRAIAKETIDLQQGEMDSLESQVAAAKARLDLLSAPARDDELRAAEARCAAAAAQLQLAQTELAKTHLVAPSAGVVAKLEHELGELSGPDAAEAAVILVDTRRLRVRAFVEEQDAPRLAVGQTARVHVEGRADAPLSGVVGELAPRMSRKQAWSDQPSERFDQKTREVLIELATIDGLLPGLSVDVEIVVE